ncbi:MAG: PKD domain-containing protein [Bacteroidales bacterium]|nr:PKD domain-containing protein [Bacteroidales bacterium]
MRMLITKRSISNLMDKKLQLQLRMAPLQPLFGKTMKRKLSPKGTNIYFIIIQKFIRIMPYSIVPFHEQILNISFNSIFTNSLKPTKMKHLTKYSWGMILLLFISLFSACKEDNTEPEVISSFTYQVDAGNYKLVAFTSAAQNFKTLSWDFGDASALSTETNPSHTYAATGTYTVKLTATSPKGATDVYQDDIVITDPNAELTKLVGDVSKTWKLLRVTTGGRYPLEVGPWDHSTIWWAMGKGNDELSKRPCLLNDEWTFTRSGLTLQYDPKGDYWAEAGIYANPGNVCAATSSMVGKYGEDLSAWGGGTFTFVLTPGSPETLKAVGKGAFVGFCKLGNGAEVSNGTSVANPLVIPTSVTYNVVKLTDGAVDTLIIEGQYKWDAGDGGYWRFVLVHYDNSADEPAIPGPKPTTGFTYTMNGLTVTCTNTTTDGVTYLWDFGDGGTSTEQSPIHTYLAGGPYTIKLIATNPNGSTNAQKSAFVTADVLTDALLQGGAWKVLAEEMSIFVGPGLGDGSWWAVPKSYMVSGTGTDNWTCITDDEFKFSVGGVYTYDTKGSTRNDGYFGGTNGCIDDAGIAASGNGAAFGSASHTYAFTPAAGNAKAIITLTNGAGKAAFLGFYKGYNGVASGVKGGENSDKTVAPNFGSATNTYSVMGYAHTTAKDYLFVSVDVSAAHDGGSAWSIILVR